MNKPLLSLRNIYKSYNHPTKVDIIDNISLEIYPEDTIAITGCSGSGKSTLLKILGTLEQPSSGTVTFSPKDSLSSLRQKHIGFLFQESLFINDENVLFNVLLPAIVANQPTHKQSMHYKRALHLLDKLNLSHRLTHPMQLLSGGEQIRAGIARSLLMQPKILLTDEPTGSLDPNTSKEVESLLFAFAQSEKIALIIVTHDHDLAKQANKWYEIKNKKLSLHA